MIQELTEDKPTREAWKMANEKTTIALVWIILFYYELGMYWISVSKNSSYTFHYSA
jgi:hypothetical protein